MAKKRGKPVIRHTNKKKGKKGNITKKNHGVVKKSYKPSISRRKLDSLPLKERMMAKLKSSKFRYMNEELYTMKGKDAMKYFKTNETAFNDYHAGYQQQVEKWPINPVDIIIKSLNSDFKSGTVIADFGCGAAKIAESLPQHTVHSFDLVALSPRVTVCDVAHTPLGSACVDVVVCCLSLMGTNLADYLKEANRILKNNGILKIAEVESRFDNVDSFLQGLESFGFEVIKTDLELDLFYFMDLKKARDLGKRAKKNLPEMTLKPCLYKKR